MSESDQKLLENIEQYGCSVIHIAPEGDLPPFAFSVGITKTSGAPEVVVIGLKEELAHFIVNEYNRRVRQGQPCEPGVRYSGFIEGFEVEVVKVDHSFYKEYFGYNIWLYQGQQFEVVQIVYPNTSGVWPWEPTADEWFRNRQPILNQAGVPEHAL
jgi:hypothetical protein